MSDTERPAKKKRGYMVDGVTLCYDLRVRLDADTAAALADHARKMNTTRAAAARDILRAALMPEK